MRINLNNTDREPMFAIDVDLKNPPAVVKDPGGGHKAEVYLDWDQTRDDQGGLRRCPVCGCRELFSRKDFPQQAGIMMVGIAAVTAMVLFGMRQVLAGLVVLGAMVVVDVVIYFFTGRCLVCYRCRSEFRRLPIRRDYPRWDLSIGEKYRQIKLGGDPSPHTTERRDL